MNNPILLQTNARLWLDALTQELGRQATFDDLPDEELDRLAAQGFDWLYLICAWQVGKAETRLSRSYASLREEGRQKLGKPADQALCGSCFAIACYEAPPSWGGQPALVRLKERLNRRGMRLMLDFIPNHTGLSHPWARQHPDFYVQGSPEEAKKRPQDFERINTEQGEIFLAHGRDPYFPSWSDTLQLNYANPALQEAMRGELDRLTGCCDGLRCDMSMLILPDIFQRTWGLEAQPFWPGAIAAIKEKHPHFTFMAEVYWNLEGELLDQGFDFTYDKSLYDRLKAGLAEAVREHIQGGLHIACQQAHFLENHDEPRAAASFPKDKHQAAAVITYFLPGLRFFFAGQMEGYAIRIPVQFCSAPREPVDAQLQAFYTRLIGLLKEVSCQPETWKLLNPAPAWHGNATHENFIAFTWFGEAGQRWLAAVNFSDHRSQCSLEMSIPEISGRKFRLYDRLNSLVYERSGDQMARDGLYLDLPRWGYHLLEFQPAE